MCKNSDRLYSRGLMGQNMVPKAFQFINKYIGRSWSVIISPNLIKTSLANFVIHHAPFLAN